MLDVAYDIDYAMQGESGEQGGAIEPRILLASLEPLGDQEGYGHISSRSRSAGCAEPSGDCRSTIYIPTIFFLSWNWWT